MTIAPIALNAAISESDLHPCYPISGWPHGVYDHERNQLEPGANGASGGWSDCGTLCGYVVDSKGPTVPSNFDEEIKLLIQELDKPISPPA